MYRLTTAPSRSRRRGQSLVEYLLLTAMLATFSIGFSKFFGQRVLGEGLKRLPDKVSPCVSHGGKAEDCQ